MSQTVLTAADIADVKKALGIAQDAKAICQKGASCGFDYSGQEAVIHQLEAQLAAVLREFGPRIKGQE